VFAGPVHTNVADQCAPEVLMLVVIGSDLPHYCGRVGAFDHRMAYILGLQRLGHEVCLVSDVIWNFDSGREQHFQSLVGAYGGSFPFSLIYQADRVTRGMSFDDAVRVAQRCDLLINIDGTFRTREILDSAPRRVFIDTGPAKTQVMSAEYGKQLGFEHHDFFFTYGLNVGTTASDVPTCSISWRPMLPPVVLDWWNPGFTTNGRHFTTISNWAKSPFSYRGKEAGTKADSWRRFIELPRQTSQELEIAMKVKEEDQSDLEAFAQNGWLIRDSRKLNTFEVYREYLGGSRAEFSVANNRYVAFNTGWFSERTARYLALGKPALVQSTGLEDHLPVGMGLLTFRTMDDIVSGIDSINAEYPEQCHAARSIAEKYLDSDIVLSGMLELVMSESMTC
jgi:hypothetical protein